MAAVAPVLVTGAAGFIGFHVARRLLGDGKAVVGLDNINDYYDPKLKEARLAELAKFDGFEFAKLDLADREGMAALFKRHRFPYVINLAAQAGVRHSLVDPYAYVDANLVGFTNILEGCRHNGCEHLLYASSSSVYGANTHMPFSVHDNVDHPLSLYGASKKANELMAHAYSHLFRLPTTGLRFFTVYGPWGRPDMAMWLFAKAIMAGEPIKLFNNGDMRRDFTYIDDIVEAIVRLVDHAPAPNPDWSGDSARSRLEQRAVAGLQHRQQQPGRTPGGRAPFGGIDRHEGQARALADAARRRDGHLRRRRRADARGRLQAGNADWRRHRALHRLVQGFSRALARPGLGG